jgi:uncharacterized damage-inducible protein DinB
MTILEFLRSRRRAEYPVFAKVLQAMPTGKFDYRPHERSASAGEIVWTLARETKACCDLIDTGQFNWVAETPPADPEAILSAFQKYYVALDDRSIEWTKAAGRKGAASDRRPAFREAPVGEFLWYIFFDAIHHRGLSTYIRPWGRVPSSRFR